MLPVGPACAAPSCLAVRLLLEAAIYLAPTGTRFTAAPWPRPNIFTCTHPHTRGTTLAAAPNPQGLLRESQQANERLQKEYNGLAEKVARLHHTLEEHIHTNTQLLSDNSQRQVEIKAKEDEIRALKVRSVVVVGGGGNVACSVSSATILWLLA